MYVFERDRKRVRAREKTKERERVCCVCVYVKEEDRETALQQMWGLLYEILYKTTVVRYTIFVNTKTKQQSTFPFIYSYPSLGFLTSGL